MTLTLAGDRRSPNHALPTGRPSLAFISHVVTLAGASALLLSQLPGQWFFFDEFEYLGSSRDHFSYIENLLRPHNEHWSALTGFTYGFLREFVGLASYWPYVLPVLALHLVAAHLLWRLIIRLGADPWVATALAAIFAMVGAGYENVVWAFQIAFVGSTVCGLASALVVIGQGSILPRHRVAFIVLSIVNLAISGLGTAWLVICGVLLFRRCGARTTGIICATPLLIYVAWSVCFGVGTQAKMIGGWSFVMTMLEFALVGLVAVGSRLIGIEAQHTIWAEMLGATVVLGLVIAGWARARSGDRTAQQAALLALFAPLFFLVAASARVREIDGVGNATASRYYYVVVVSVLPLVAMVITRLIAVRRRLALPIAVGFIVLAVSAATTYVRGAEEWSAGSAEFHLTALAEMELLRSGVEVYPDNHPETLMLPNYVSQADLRRWMATSEVEPLTLTEVDHSTAALMLQVKIDTSSPPAGNDCSTATAPLRPGDRNLSLAVRSRGVVGLVLTDQRGVTSRARSHLMAPGTYAISALVPGTVQLAVSEGDAGLCPSTSN